MSKFLRELEKATTSKELNYFHGIRPMVIVVDEANALKPMTNQPVTTVSYFRKSKHSWNLLSKYQNRPLKFMLS